MEEEKRQELPLPEAAREILEECRMVLPGIQALFGFQLIAVINQAFGEKLTTVQQRLHLASIALVAIAVALVMAPAAYHRQTGPKEVSEEFIMVASRLLLWSMVPLMVAITLEFHIIAALILDNQPLSLALSVPLFAVFLGLWFVLPRWRKMQKGVSRSRK